MALNEETKVDNITILEDGQLQVRTARIIRDGNVEIARSFHRHVVVPSQDYSGEADRVQAVAIAVFTSGVIQDYLDSLPP